MSAGTALHRLVRPGSWSLRFRLTALVVALLAVVSVVIGGVAFVAVRSSLAGNFDAQVQEATQRTVRTFEINGGSNSNGLGIDSGTILVLTTSTGSIAKYITTASSEITGKSLTTAQMQAISDAHFEPSGDCSFASIDVPGYGTYRFCSTFQGQVVVGLPQSTLERQTAAVLGALALLVLGAIILAGVSATLVIGRALRPLRRVAGVASNVAQMRLDRGDVHLAQRVPDADTNPHTEVGQVGAALNNLLDSVDSALGVRQASEEKVRHFVADASHELRTPLASIRGYAELTRRFGVDLDETSAHNVERIESEAKRMTSLVEDLLLLARLDAERELELGEVDLSRLLVDAVSDAHAAGRDHEWDFELPDEPVTVRGDEARLHQVFANLLTNARVHTPAGTRVAVELDAPSGDVVEVRVRDFGPGIPDSLQPTLFERFVRGDSSRNRNTGSTGLGLSIVAAVVQAHHGTVEVESEPGETVFTVRLPVHQVATGLIPTVQPA